MINTVLVIDDNALDNAVLRNYLYNEHLNLISALNGREALDMLEGRNIDVIVLDLVMPVMDGLSFLKAFKKTSFYGKVPVIVTTSRDSEDIIHKVITEYEVFDYILKPLDKINKMILINKIRSAIRYRNALKELDTLRRKKDRDGN
ncbi:MAG TPA: response regulator [Thermoclostridium caenicola]|uniref:Stage 0 sporulation protein A homolog n=1 Tax=Thermoclostridium caenicola TaxID=659425 RepID=A0A1M6IJB4_9FIRM|nr:response regulator [Thermoclostridium caenicola]SHJ34562.1 two-component system, chemotaxis family, response regulator CheY [Thermoclostridium caenicola]HOK43095.1 response regulator [Thermoclostridium caenicola]HOL85403.1 response regulator [Thermoclostridium caenicola]HOP72206.1 response regulator [Thermoclostridium caenicola]HPO77189.1 response regulator [Thermoclostridium caenicola]